MSLLKTLFVGELKLSTPKKLLIMAIAQLIGFGIGLMLSGCATQADTKPNSTLIQMDDGEIKCQNVCINNLLVLYCHYTSIPGFSISHIPGRPGLVGGGVECQ